METFAELISIAGALLLSVSCCLLLEELIFGGLVWLFFARQLKTGIDKERNDPKAPKETGERPCLR
jgi:hypothetical protein